MPSGGLSLKIKRDDLTPDLVKKLRLLQNPEPIWRAVGTQLVSLTKRAFRDPSLRQIAWPNKRDGAASNLIRKGMLLSSIRITKLDKRGVQIGSDRPYAAIHQLGGIIEAKGKKPLVFNLGGKLIFARKVKIPPRPFFPFLPDGTVAPVAVEPLQQIVQAAGAKALGAS